MANFTSWYHTGSGNELETITIAASANGTYSFKPGHPIRAMSLQAKGGGGNNFGSGTVELLASNDNTNFFSLPTSKTLSADGIKTVAVIDCGFLYYQVALTGSTAPTLTITVSMAYNHS